MSPLVEVRMERRSSRLKVTRLLLLLLLGFPLCPATSCQKNASDSVITHKSPYNCATEFLAHILSH